MPPGEAEQGAETTPEESVQPEKATVFGGVAVADIADDIRTALNLSKDIKGAVIAEIDADSPAAQAGLREGDVIQEVNKQPVKNAKDLVAVSKKLKPNERILMRVYRNKQGNALALYEKGEASQSTLNTYGLGKRPLRGVKCRVARWPSIRRRFSPLENR